MSENFSWTKFAKDYDRLYRETRGLPLEDPEPEKKPELVP